MKRLVLCLGMLGASLSAYGAGADEIFTHVSCSSQERIADGGFGLKIVSGGFIGTLRAELTEGSIMGTRPVATYMGVESTVREIFPRVSDHKAEGFVLTVKQGEPVGRASFVADLHAKVEGRGDIVETMVCYDEALHPSVAANISVYSDGLGNASAPFEKLQDLIGEELVSLRLTRYTLLGVGIEGGGGVCVEFTGPVQVEEFVKKAATIVLDENVTLNAQRTFICEE